MPSFSLVAMIAFYYTYADARSFRWPHYNFIPCFTTTGWSTNTSLTRYRRLALFDVHATAAAINKDACEHLICLSASRRLFMQSYDPKNLLFHSLHFLGRHYTTFVYRASRQCTLYPSVYSLHCGSLALCKWRFWLWMMICFWITMESLLKQHTNGLPSLHPHNISIYSPSTPLSSIVQHVKLFCHAPIFN